MTAVFIINNIICMHAHADYARCIYSNVHLVLFVPLACWSSTHLRTGYSLRTKVYTWSSRCLGCTVCSCGALHDSRHERRTGCITQTHTHTTQNILQCMSPNIIAPQISIVLFITYTVIIIIIIILRVFI